MIICWGARLIPSFQVFMIFSTSVQDKQLLFLGTNKVNILHIFTKFNKHLLFVGVLDRLLDLAYFFLA